MELYCIWLAVLVSSAFILGEKGHGFEGRWILVKLFYLMFGVVGFLAFAGLMITGMFQFTWWIVLLIPIISNIVVMPIFLRIYRLLPFPVYIIADILLATVEVYSICKLVYIAFYE